MTAAFDDPAAPARRDLLSLDAAARVPEGAEVVGIGVSPGTRSVRLPGGSSLDAAYLARRGFEAKVGQVLALPAEDAPKVFLALGLGSDADGPAGERLRLAAAALVRSAGRATWVALVPGSSGLAPATVAQSVAEGAALATYRYHGFKSGDSDRPGPQRLTLVLARPGQVQEALRRGAAIASAVALVRDLVNEPPGSLTPSRFAAIASAVAADRGLDVRVYDAEAIQAERLGGLAGVARGSDEEARLVRLEYRPAGGDGSPDTLALVGKGITFDSGGLSLKTADGMMTMKDDMAGAAVVLGTMSLLAELGVAVRVLGFAPLTENMPGGLAIKPGDVLRARNGKTIEVLNTDAEGRLVLADGLSLAAEEKPAAIIDLATLTGAVVSALGRQIAGLMGNDDTLLEKVEAAAARSGERVWRLPLPPDYRRDIDSDVADMKNIGKPGQAGSVIAGLFLQEFVDGIPWAHLDIAGTAFGDTDAGYTTRGATGFGVRALVELLSGWDPRPA